MVEEVGGVIALRAMRAPVVQTDLGRWENLSSMMRTAFAQADSNLNLVHGSLDLRAFDIMP